MTVVESKLKTGKLTLAVAPDPPIEFACQATSVIVASEYKEDGEAQETLCGDVLPASTSVSKTLKIVAIQDFDNPDGLMVYLREHELEQLDFTWQPNAQADTASGQVQARLGDWGGDVNKRLTTSLDLPITNLVWTPPAGP